MLMIVHEGNSLLMISGSCLHKWIYKDSLKLPCKSPSWSNTDDRLEDLELAQTEVFNGGDDGSHITTSTVLPSRAQARQWFTKRQMARISPRLGLLNNLPMAVPFRTRLEVFRQFVA